MPFAAHSRLVKLLVDAHGSGASVGDDASLIPPSFDDAMAVQVATLAALGRQAGGWKVGFNAQGQSVAGPMLDDCIHASSGSWPLGDAGPMIAEVEIAVRLAHDLPPRPGRAYVRAEIVAAVSHVLAGIELIQSRLTQGMAAPFPLWLADRLGNAGYIRGPELSDFARLDLEKLRCRFWVDGALVHDKAGGHPQTDPLAPLLAWANAQNDRLGGPKAGQIVTTGSLITPMPCAKAVRLEAEIEGLGRVAVALA